MKSQLKSSLSLVNFNPSIFRRNYAKRLSRFKRNSKKEIIHRVTDNGEKVSELSKEYGVVAKTIYKLLGRKANQSSAVLELSKLRRENEALLSIIGSLVAESKLGKKKR